MEFVLVSLVIVYNELYKILMITAFLDPPLKNYIVSGIDLSLFKKVKIDNEHGTKPANITW